MQTSRLTLRALDVSDARWMARDIANPEVQRWLTAPPHPYRVSDAEDFITRFQDDPGFRIIEAAGAPLGMVSIGVFAEGDLPELGYWLKQEAWGQGVMSEAAGALVDWFFTRQDGLLVSGWVEGNAASQRILSKLGFGATGETRLQTSRFLGREVPVVRAALHKETWQARKSA